MNTKELGILRAELTAEELCKKLDNKSLRIIVDSFDTPTGVMMLNNYGEGSGAMNIVLDHDHEWFPLLVTEEDIVALETQSAQDYFGIRGASASEEENKMGYYFVKGDLIESARLELATRGIES